MNADKLVLRVLHVEDSERDATLLDRSLIRAGYELVTERVETAAALREILSQREWDVILCDYSMPQFNALAALNVLKEMRVDTPFIIISGTIGESSAVEAMRSGANDYMIKDSLARLVPAIERELKEAENRRARREAEQALLLQSVALEAAANGMMITNANGEIIWVNPALTRSSGYSAQELIGQTPRLLKSGKQDDSFYKELWETILAGKIWHNTIINQRKDGALYHDDMTIAPIRDPNGTITHFVAVEQDITELQRALAQLTSKNQELALMTQQLWHASKLATMGELAASVAHELNNPLATVTLRVELLTMQLPANSPMLQPLAVISHEVERMAKLVHNLLEFSRRGHRQISTLDIRHEITHSVEFVQYYLRNRKIEVVTEFPKSLDTIQADRQHLRQLFLNLLTNASDAMPKGGKLTVRARNSMLENTKAVQVEFSDTGEGISAEDREKVWEPFFTTKTEGKGTGLGLAICRRIVDEHRGRIEIESETGLGTTVRVTLPATNGDVEASDEQ
jgi:PAS domain S-box-containing protein